MTTADTWLWGKYTDDKKLQQKLAEITQRSFDAHRGYYGCIGERCVIKNSSIIKDVRIGTDCYIKGASKLKNITINSSDQEPSQIGENVILVNGIVGYGCRIFYSCTAVKFVPGNNSNLKYGARLIDSIMGDNSTISCCEVLNNLIFPAHEQHHNNSFLIASTIMGQSNMAAGATMGSNHNSRTNDGELVAGRGFWPGLCSSVKHSSRFASFVLLAKGDYPAEMDIPLPFALISNNITTDSLEIRPAWWWMHNMYALARNAWKYYHRDKRIKRTQHIEFETLAPDSMQEVQQALKLLELWTGQTVAPDATHTEQKTLGRQLLNAQTHQTSLPEILVPELEKGNRPVRIFKPREAYLAYTDMTIHYAFTQVANAYEQTDTEAEDFQAKLTAQMQEGRTREWVNLGGQPARADDVEDLRADITCGNINSWEDIHHRYDELWLQYPHHRLTHALHMLCDVMQTTQMDARLWDLTLQREEYILHYITEEVRRTRQKDYDNPFRSATCRCPQEAEAVFGHIEEDPFVLHMQQECTRKLELLSHLRKVLCVSNGQGATATPSHTNTIK